MPITSEKLLSADRTRVAAFEEISTSDNIPIIPLLYWSFVVDPLYLISSVWKYGALLKVIISS